MDSLVVEGGKALRRNTATGAKTGANSAPGSAHRMLPFRSGEARAWPRCYQLHPGTPTEADSQGPLLLLTRRHHTLPLAFSTDPPPTPPQARVPCSNPVPPQDQGQASCEPSIGCLPDGQQEPPRGDDVHCVLAPGLSWERPAEARGPVRSQAPPLPTPPGLPLSTLVSTKEALATGSPASRVHLQGLPTPAASCVAGRTTRGARLQQTGGCRKPSPSAPALQLRPVRMGSHCVQWHLGSGYNSISPGTLQLLASQTHALPHSPPSHTA